MSSGNPRVGFDCKVGSHLGSQEIHDPYCSHEALITNRGNCSFARLTQTERGYAYEAAITPQIDTEQRRHAVTVTAPNVSAHSSSTALQYGSK
jgi:hypothetical protein